MNTYENVPDASNVQNAHSKWYCNLVFCTILLVNLVAILFILWIKRDAILTVCSHFSARNFLETLEYPPNISTFRVWMILIQYGLLVTSESLNRKWGLPNQNVGFLFIWEMFLAVCITIELDFGYRGVMLMPVTCIMRYDKNNPSRLVSMLILLVLFILADYNIVSGIFHCCPIDAYISSYTVDSQRRLLTLLNVLTCTNEVCCMAFMILTLQIQMNRTHEVQHLLLQTQNQSEELRVVNAQLSEYATQVDKMSRTAERNRIAREIHDTLGHSMTGIAMGLEACLETTDTLSGQTRSQLEHIAETARSCLNDVRRSVNALRPDKLEKFSLHDALESLAADISTLSSIDVSLHQPDVYTLNVEEEIVIYRLIQESITNAVRHGNAKHVLVLIRSEDRHLLVHIHDDGRGCENIQRGFGITHMSERVALLGGSISFDGKNGFTIDAKIPLSWEWSA